MRARLYCTKVKCSFDAGVPICSEVPGRVVFGGWRVNNKAKDVFHLCSVSSHIAGLCKWLQLLVRARLVVRHKVPESLRSRLAEPPGSPVCVRMVRCDETVFGSWYPALGVKELCRKWLSGLS